MPLIEVEDQYLSQFQSLGIPAVDRTAEYQRAREHETFLTKLSQDPKHRSKVMELVADSGVYVPEIERVKEVRSEFNTLLADRLKPLDDFLARQKEREDAEQTRSVQKLVDDGRAYLRKQGWDDDGVKEVETFMRDHAVGDYAIASEHLKRQKPDPTPLPTTSWNGSDLGNSWFSPADDAPDHQLLMKDPRAFANAEIRKFMRETPEQRLRG